MRLGDDEGDDGDVIVDDPVEERAGRDVLATLAALCDKSLVFSAPAPVRS